MRSSKTPIRTVACAVGLGLMFVQAALAADKQPIRFNAADQAAAKAVTLKAADFGPGWKGGPKKPDLTPDDKCATKVSDLVITGAASSKFQGPGVSVTTESEVLQSPAMVAADWQRSVGNAGVLACIRSELMRTDEAGVTMVSFKRVAFPKVAQFAARFRTVVDYDQKGSSVRAVIDMVVFGKGRTELTLILTARYADRAQADVVEQALAKLLVSRVAA
jgi:hypothetical protein